jgi:UDP-GlcNAc:undecaprenyl-phosphate GlcNAc-1-phosphate transferase
VNVLLGGLAGVAAGRLIWMLMRGAFAHPVLRRENYRGHQLPTATGIVLALALLAVEGVRVVVESLGDEVTRLGAARGATLLTVVGFALLGFVDDVLGDAGARGFRGHVTALGRGRLTTGGVKLVGGGLVALVACGIIRPASSPARLLSDAALVALAANLGNLFDRAPGRSIKVGILAGAGLVAATGAPAALSGVAAVVGASLALLPEDLGEDLMLGDAGANALGGVLGLGVVLTCDGGTRLVVLAVLAAANLASEVVSFSRVIDAVAPLRVLDRAGRRRQ